MNALISRDLQQVAERRMVEPARQAGHELRPMGVAPALTEPICVEERPGKWWVATPYEDDPVRQELGGRFPVPTRQRELVLKLAQTGFDPDELIVVHEMERGWRPGQDLSVLTKPYTKVPFPLAVARGSARLYRGAALAGQAVGKGLSTATEHFGSLVMGLAVLVATDPVLVGGVRCPSQRDLLAWYEITRWSV